MLQFIATMRRLSGGKPASFKLCIGHTWEFLAVCKAMVETEIYPDFIVVDGNEGGTGAAPLEFTDHLGTPLREGLNFVHNALIGINARLAPPARSSAPSILPASWRWAPTGAIRRAASCSRSAASSRCPAIPTAARSAFRRRTACASARSWSSINPSACTFHHATIESLAELVAAAGLDHPTEFGPAHFSRHVSPHEAQTFAELYPTLEPGELLAGSADKR